MIGLDIGREGEPTGGSLTAEEPGLQLHVSLLPELVEGASSAEGDTGAFWFGFQLQVSALATGGRSTTGDMGGAGILGLAFGRRR